MSEQAQIFKYLESISEVIPCPFYWINAGGKFVGINSLCVIATGSLSKEYIIGKTVHELYQNQEIADKLQHDIDKIIKTGEISRLEDEIVDVSTGKARYYMATRAPLRDSANNIIGVVGTSTEITAEKEAEELRIKNKQHELENQLLQLENEKYQIEKKAQEKLIQFVDNISNMIQRFKLDTVNKKLGLTNNSIAKSEKVTLTRREEQVLYFIAMGKSPKEIATILGKFENKIISDATIGGMINKQLYPKLGVASYGQLVDKATSLGLIHFIPDSLKDFFMV